MAPQVEKEKEGFLGGAEDVVVNKESVHIPEKVACCVVFGLRSVFTV